MAANEVDKFKHRLKLFRCPIDGGEPDDTWTEGDTAKRRWFRCGACGHRYPIQLAVIPNDPRRSFNGDPRRQMPR